MNVVPNNIDDIVNKTAGHQGFFVSRVECSDRTNVSFLCHCRLLQLQCTAHVLLSASQK